MIGALFRALELGHMVGFIDGLSGNAKKATVVTESEEEEEATG